MAAFTPEPFAAALGVSTLTGLQLLADALDLQHRLPRIWAAVEALAVAPWKARKIAQATHHLSQAAAASVDAQLADRIGSCGWRAIETAVAQAIATHDPHLLETREKQGRDAWGVRLYHRGVGTDGGHDWAGTSHLEVTGDTLDLTTFHDLVCDQAAQLKALGDTDDLDVRKAKAVGVIANRQAALDLGTLLGGSSGVGDAATAEPVETVGGRSLAKTSSTCTCPWPTCSAPIRQWPWHGGEVRAGQHRLDQRLGRPVPGHHPTRPRHAPRRSRRRPRPTRLDARTRYPPRPELRLPLVHPRRQSLRSGPHHPLRRERPTRPDQPRRPLRPLPTTPPRENLPAMALPPHPSRQLPMDRTPGTDLPGHPHRHPPHPAQLTGGRAPSARPVRGGAPRRREAPTRGGTLEAHGATTGTRPDAGSPAQPTWSPHSTEQARPRREPSRRRRCTANHPHTRATCRPH